VPDGYEAALTSSDFQDRLIALSWSEDSEGWGYFDPDIGWVNVHHERVTRFRVDMQRVISSIACQFGFAKNALHRIFIDDLLWDLGSYRFGKRSKKTPMLFARRLNHLPSSKLIQRALQTRPLDEVPLLLTSTSRKICFL
jgi:hypothetical protein